ncbi:MAG: YchJ family protein [Candidatus Contendobacter sp.]|nr:YchJ family protein [Candidatus Contendobacter sp.]
MNPGALCPCGSAKPYSACCGPFLDHAQQPDTAEALMRSRYSAYVLVREEYLLRTWHPSTRPQALNFDNAEAITWLGLKIVRTEVGDSNDQQGMVEFVARYKVSGKAHRMVEISRFVRESGQWFYLDGTLSPATKPVRR